MKKLWILFASVLLGASAVWAQRDFGARNKPIPNTGRPELRRIDAAMFDSGFMFNDKVRQAYFDLCMEQVAPQLHFSELTWEWLQTYPEVFNACFSLEYPPNPNIIHNFVKLAYLVGPHYARKYRQLLIAFAVANQNQRLLTGLPPRKKKQLETDRYGNPIGEPGYEGQTYELPKLDRYGNLATRNFVYDPATKGNIERGVRQQSGWYLNHDVKVPADAEFAKYPESDKLYPDEVERKQRLATMHRQFDLSGNPKAQEVANWLKRNRGTKIYEINQMDVTRFAKKTGITIDEQTFKHLPWDTIAHAAGRYPSRSDATIAETLCMRIQRYEEKGAEKSKLFPLADAPWPLLLLLTQLDPADEASYWWNMYREKGSVPEYATYSFDYEKPDFRYNDGQWDPNATPRILVDGGVCGRLSTMAEFAQRSIGTPAQGMGQPGHRAFMTYNYDHGSGKYSATMHHSVNVIDVSTVEWRLPPLWGATYDSETKLYDFGPMLPNNSTNDERNNIRNHIGLCEAMNRGLGAWEDTRMAMIIYEFYPDASDEQKEALLRSAFMLNVANTDVIYRIAKLRKGNSRATEKLRDAFRKGFVDTAAGCTGDKPIKADQDLSALLRSNSIGARNPKKVTNEWALFVSNSIFMGTYANIPNEYDPIYEGAHGHVKWIDDKNDYAKAVAEELKYQKRLGNSPFLQDVQRLNDKYDEVRLAGNIDRRVNLEEMRRRIEFEKNCW